MAPKVPAAISHRSVPSAARTSSPNVAAFGGGGGAAAPSTPPAPPDATGTTSTAFISPGDMLVVGHLREVTSSSLF